MAIMTGIHSPQIIGGSSEPRVLGRSQPQVQSYSSPSPASHANPEPIRTSGNNGFDWIV